LLTIPDEWTVVALVTLGYPAEKPGSRPKKPLDEIVSYNTF
jgi:nitroreductase